MKKLALSAMMLALVSAYPAFAVEEHHPEQKPGASAPQAGVSAKPAADPEKAVQKLKDNTKKLQAQLDKIGKAKDARERQKLLGEHMQTMQESMMVAGAMGSGGMMGGGMMGCPMMSGMMGGGMMSGGMMGGGQGGGMMGGGMMGGGASGPGGNAMMGHMQQMEKRMDMMQMMMESLMKSQGQAQQK